MNRTARSKMIGLVGLLIFLIGCSSSPPVPTATVPPTETLPPPTPTILPRAPVSSAEVERTASAFEALARLEGEAWHSADSQAFRAVFNTDAVFTDRTFGDHAAGIEAIEALAANTALLVPTWKARSMQDYISLAGGLEVVNIWDLELGGHKFTEADPQVEMDWLQTRDRSITAMTLLYSLDSLKKSYKADRERLDQANLLLSSYQSAWSSGDAQAVAALYASDAVREDSLFGEKQPGPEAIGSFAKSFFAWYPGAQWSLALGFGEGRGDAPKTGGLYIIRVNDMAGQPCDIQVAVLFQVSEGRIAREDLFYAPESLVKCGWAR